MPRITSASLALLAGLAASALLSGCATPADSFIVSPTIVTAQQPHAQGQAIDLLCADLRPSQTIVTMHYDYAERPAEQLPGASRPDQQICNQLGEAWLSQGYSIEPGASTQVIVSIQQLGIDVQQSRTRYQADSEVALHITIRRPDQKLEQPFSGSAHSSGLLQVDIASLERDFNHLLGRVLTDIAQHKTLSEQLK